MIDTNLIAFLKAAGTAAGTRIHTGNAPQGTALPAVIIRRTAGSTPRVLGGQPLFSRAQFSIDVVGTDYATALPVANAVRVLLDGYNGVIGDSTVQSARFIAEPAAFDEIDGDQVFRRLSQDVLFLYKDP